MSLSVILLKEEKGKMNKENGESEGENRKHRKNPL